MPDRPYLRLASFAVLLVIIFGLALVVGRQYGPNMESNEAAPTHDAMRTSEGEAS